MSSSGPRSDKRSTSSGVARDVRDVTKARLPLTRAQILAFRRRVGGLDERLPAGRPSLRRAAWAGLQDSMPRAALLSLHARVAGVKPSTWEDASLVQLWGPRYNVYVVAARDHAVFSLGRLPDNAQALTRAQDIAARLSTLFAGAQLPSGMTYGKAGRALGIHPNRLRYAAATGTVLIRWDGARLPTVWTVPPPQMGAREAGRELARRYLHIYGPVTARAFARWASIGVRQGESVFEDLRASLTAVRTPLGAAWILSSDEPAFRAARAEAVAAARLLPSGDAFTLGADRELLVPDPHRRRELWTPRVWPGCLLVDGELAGTWRRAQQVVTIQPWRRLSPGARAAVDEEAAALPLPGDAGPITVRWAR